MNLKRAHCENQSMYQEQSSCSSSITNHSSAVPPSTNGQPFCRTVRVGSRKSNLALIQTNLVIEKLKMMHRNLNFELVTMDTLGDLVLDRELHKIGGKNLFTKELEDALLSNQVDFVVHSMKDLPTEMPDPSLVIGCVIERESCFDVVIFRDRSPHNPPLSLATLPVNSVVGTSSVRRVAALKRAYPHLQFRPVRGNLNTRLNKLDAPRPTEIINSVAITDNDNGSVSLNSTVYYDAIVLARAGVDRMGWTHLIGEVLDSELSACESGSSFPQHNSLSKSGSICDIQDVSGLYAVGQGALACECRRDDKTTLAMLSVCHNERSALTCIAERSFMHSLGGSCSTPIAVRSDMSSIEQLCLTGTVLTPDGNKCLFSKDSIRLPLYLPPTVRSGDNEFVCCKRFKSEDEHLNLDSSSYMNPTDPACSFYCVCGSNNCSDSLITANAADNEDFQQFKESNGVHIVRQLYDKREQIEGHGEIIDVKEPVMGVLIHPICIVAVKRMMEAKKLGRNVASELFGLGARDILGKLEPGSKLLSAPKQNNSDISTTIDL